MEKWKFYALWPRRPLVLPHQVLLRIIPHHSIPSYFHDKIGSFFESTYHSLFVGFLKFPPFPHRICMFHRFLGPAQSGASSARNGPWRSSSIGMAFSHSAGWRPRIFCGKNLTRRLMTASALDGFSRVFPSCLLPPCDGGRGIHDLQVSKSFR